MLFRSAAKPSSKATEEDARRAGIPAGYSYKNWDPTEEPIMLLGSNAGGQSTYNNVTGEITLEGTSIYVAIGSNGSGVVACLGWEDNI